MEGICQVGAWWMARRLPRGRTMGYGCPPPLAGGEGWWGWGVGRSHTQQRWHQSNYCPSRHGDRGKSRRRGGGSECRGVCRGGGGTRVPAPHRCEQSRKWMNETAGSYTGSLIHQWAHSLAANASFSSQAWLHHSRFKESYFVFSLSRRWSIYFNYRLMSCLNIRSLRLAQPCIFVRQCHQKNSQIS